MNRQDMEAYARARIEASAIMLEEADSLLSNNFTRGAVARIYYSMFQLVNAYAFLKGFEIRRHRSARSLFHKEFIHKGVISRETGRTFEIAYMKRTEGDYHAIVHEKPEVEQLLQQAKEFNSKLTSLINDELSRPQL
ncbi:MAG: HEPN domain-containing protein [Candidatus Lindowbacteria bacterium]|nr:HEPN domain-containing protein [Candidatus Lindowbacteria bacterium]